MPTPTPTPAVTVVVPHHGPSDPTLALLDSLDAQRDVTTQLVVVDDASAEPFPDDARALVVRREHNGGFASAVNSGVAHAEHDLVLVLNSDVEIGADFVADLLRAAAPWQPAVVSPRVVDAAGEDAWVGRRFPTTAQQGVEWLTPLARLRDHPRWRTSWHRGVGHDVPARGRTAEVDWVIGAAMLIPTALLREVGGFDERFHMNAEEVDLQRRLRARGVRSVVLAEPVVTHAGGRSSDPERRRRWLVESRLAYAEKWHGAAGVRRLRLALRAATAVNLAANGVRRAAGRDIAPLRTARAELALLAARSGGSVSTPARSDPTMGGRTPAAHRGGESMRSNRSSVVLARRLVESGPSLRWHAARLRMPVLRRAFGAIGSGTVVVAPARLRGVETIRIGADCAVYEGGWLQAEPGGIDIGDHTYLGPGVHVHAIDPVRIGAGCVLADGVLITSAEHDGHQGPGSRHGAHGTGAVVIGDDVFVGQRAVVLGGVSIGDGATVGAHAVVTHDVPAGSTVVGVPARIVETKPEQERS